MLTEPDSSFSPVGAAEDGISASSAVCSKEHAAVMLFVTSLAASSRTMILGPSGSLVRVTPSGRLGLEAEKNSWRPEALSTLPELMDEQNLEQPYDEVA